MNECHLHLANRFPASDSQISMCRLCIWRTDRRSPSHWTRRPTKLHGLSGFFSCSRLRLLAFPGDAFSTCQWVDSSTIYVTPAVEKWGERSIRVGDVITSHPCEECVRMTRSMHCFSLLLVGVGRGHPPTPLTVQGPLHPIYPTTAVSLPAVMGSCDSLRIDISGSTGGCGRPWSNLSLYRSSQFRWQRILIMWSPSMALAATTKIP
jgi:hypothetical protein